VGQKGLTLFFRNPGERSWPAEDGGLNGNKLGKERGDKGWDGGTGQRGNAVPLSFTKRELFL